MAYQTKTDVETKALGVLGVTTAGQPPEQDDLLRIDGYYSPVLATLAAQEVVYVGDPDNVPDAWVLQIAICLANAAKIEFGIASDESAELEVKEAKARTELKAMTRGRPTYQPFRMDHI